MKKCIIIFYFLTTISFIHGDELQNIIDTYIRYNKWSESVEKLDELLKTYPDNPEISSLLSIVYIELKLYDKAIITLRKAINSAKNDEKRGEYYYNLGNIYYLQSNFSIALDMFMKSIEFNPLLAGSYYFTGLIHFEKNDTDSAISSWRKYIEYSNNTDKKNKLNNIIRLIEKSALDAKQKKEDEERRRNDLLDFLKNQLDSKSDQATSLQEYKINKENELEEEFELID
ncbi:MAG: hypothetical protein A2015_09960 [Spirochaetes bacterium GWF1_31_7]|nr:MAG: hypothetical protein A2Y30_10715 [Spirochaetes bacterium GWE1_32_154]OHD48280.1 MAG: hypothetical protein A2015_09960 [Spirochaetes bacterium GWF1_31_7]OHD51845.1 MAG: hypothetical protein A2Y29_17325 [Spirochaetes bacterium GWE2_31_10]HBI37299.1 hypothetical protein [Spirochaetia bacterium]